MDNFCEQLVEKRRTGADNAKMILTSLGLILGASLCMFGAMIFGLTILIVVAVGLLALGVWLISGMNVEYEYIVTNNELDIDKIIGRRKRKRMITLDLSKANDFGAYPYDGDIEADTTVHATTGFEKNAHYLVVEHSGN